MRPILPLKPGDEGKSISDIHRKLASLRHQLRSESSDKCYRFLRGESTTVYGADMSDAINVFKRTFANKPEENGICDAATWALLNEKAGSVYAEVWQYELDALKLRRDAERQNKTSAAKHVQPEIVAARQDAEMIRRHAPVQTRRRSNDPAEAIKVGNTEATLKMAPANEDEVIATAHAAELAGLALSGGGIRSATFNLGILQALAERKMLGDFDYLSTVSGGGYIGSWFCAWLKREDGDLQKVSDGLSPGTADRPASKEAEQIRFLRQYSNYLTPRTGMFSADTWTLLSTYFRNTVLNLAILASLLGAALILPRLLGFLAGEIGPKHPGVFAIVGAATVLWAVFYIALSISSTPSHRTLQWRRGQSQASILMLVVLPLMVSAFASSVAVWHYRTNFSDIWDRIPPDTANPVLTWIVLPGLLYFFAWFLGWACAQLGNRRRRQPGVGKWQIARPILREGAGHFFCAVIALAVGVLVLTWSVSTISRWQLAQATLDGAGRGMLLVSYGMPLILSIFGMSMILAVGLVGRIYNDKSREWWSRQGGWTSICTLGWIAVTAVALYSAPILGYLYANLGGWVQALIGSAWLGTTLAGLLLGQSSATGKRGSRPYLEWVAALAPLVFSIGALFLISTAVYWMMVPSLSVSDWGGVGYKHWNDALNNYFVSAHGITAKRAGIVFVCLLVAGLALARRVDVNKFSLSMMYRNRLVRAYLGASNARRNPNPFTGFDEHDDMPMDTLLSTKGTLQRPYPIINTSLNLVNGKELAWQTRKAAGFAFTPAFCGFELPSMAKAGPWQVVHESERGCFRPTSGYGQDNRARGDEEGSIRLGMAVAVSGAAVSPNMGYHTSPALSFLMTLFNVRLGRWFANPRRKNWARPAPRFGIRYLLAELFGLSDADANFVYLSDGGHFENLGIYELVRRRCRLIVVIDASADGQLDFEDLGNAIRKCATDLHIEIDIDAREIVPQLPDEFSRAHCVVGDILYERTDPGAKNGTLLYVKPSLIATDYAEVLNYRKANKEFPHQSTADQWFDETQFESYRSLGYRIGMTVFAPPVLSKPPSPPPPPPPQTGDHVWPDHSIPELAEALCQAWGNKKSAGSPAVAVPVTPSPPAPAREDAPA
jgi:hypothetical protein